MKEQKTYDTKEYSADVRNTTPQPYHISLYCAILYAPYGPLMAAFWGARSLGRVSKKQWVHY